MAESPGAEEQATLPTAELVKIDSHISLLPPLSRRGYGPGLIIVLPDDTPTYTDGGTVCEDGIPPPLLKWAEEGFAVLEIREAALRDTNSVQNVVDKAVAALEQCKQCRSDGGIGMIVYDSSIWNTYLKTTTLDPKVKAVVIYGGDNDRSSDDNVSIPKLQHTTPRSQMAAKATNSINHIYRTARSSKFAIPRHTDFDSVNESIAHTRNLTFLKKYIRGADFDLEQIWEEHTYFEFVVRSVPETMATMVQEPYVNHIPTMTGGIGRERLTNFYRHHFIYNNPEDTSMTPVSRTVGIDRICDEFIFNFTHDKQMDWILPGIPPTGRRVEVPFTSVVCVRGDRLYHEHISWDQASVLVQLGLIPEYLPYPYPLPDGTKPGPGKRFEYRVPAAGRETSVKMLDKNAVPSNGMFEYEIREVDDV
ncbi:hypothetical protein ABEF92_007629 [Exophiala dermatitidis]|uniref:Carboxymethylenebutenolidase n=1 Tax=Exophiala dermatitidis (strain ATCC 34100 / CBS 525.76 / NIH/UT8656) TaxID=858893 RepID=H6C4I4_EXODN|nr:carboxymethylenebutenolidase [Exophiala dermatitidis NIH/UT8656]EHY58466.1 carboxymethylenebutenolidase [Exophiala dermatitidis NIH/UT8656]